MMDAGSLAALLDREGRVTRWPKKQDQKRSVLEYLGGKFSADVEYSEREVNAALDAWHLFGDHALLRRELFERGFLDRTPDGRRYWLPRP